MDLAAQLQEQNDRYWRVRNRVKATQLKLKSSDRHKKRQCRYATNLMIANGSIVKTACEVCGNENSQTHHLDYENPEAVIFLCQKHHREWHNTHDIH